MKSTAPMFLTINLLGILLSFYFNMYNFGPLEEYTSYVKWVSKEHTKQPVWKYMRIKLRKFARLTPVILKKIELEELWYASQRRGEQNTWIVTMLLFFFCVRKLHAVEEYLDETSTESPTSETNEEIFL